MAGQAGHLLQDRQPDVLLTTGNNQVSMGERGADRDNIALVTS